MATINYPGNTMVQEVSRQEQPYTIPIWNQALTWLIMVPVVFISLGGWISADNTPIAFRLTAMYDDSLSRRLIKLACTLLIFCLISTQSRALVQLCKRSKLLLFFPAIAIVSVVWSQNRGHSLIDALMLLTVTLFAIYLFLRYPGEDVLSIVGIGAFIVLLLSVLSVTVFPSVGIDPYHDGAWRAVFGQRNTCALNCTAFLTVGLHMPARGLVERLIRASVILLSAFFTIMSLSRTGWLLAALVIVLTYGLRVVARIRSLDRILFLMVLTIPTVVIGFLIFNNLTEVLALMDKDPTMTQRTVIWAEVVPSILKHPLLGYGFSGFWNGLNGESMQAVLVTGWMEGQAQDGYLDILLQLGLAGLIPMIVLFLRAGAQSLSALDQKRLGSSTLWAIMLMPVLLIGNIGETSLLQPLSPSWFYATIAFLILSVPSRRAEGF